jgi:OPA family sugar phosphate sensor protein UhpC-like MFS transporter
MARQAKNSRRPAPPSRYLNRGTLTYSAPVMVGDPLLGLTKADIGAMTSAFPAAYGATA